MFQPVQNQECSVQATIQPNNTPSFAPAIPKQATPQGLPSATAVDDLGATMPTALRSPRQDRTVTILDHIEKIVTSVLQLMVAFMQYAQKPTTSAEPTDTTPLDTPPTEDTPETQPAEKITSGRTLPSSGEFLWKPVSDKDGKLAVLLPSSLSTKANSVQIVSPDATKIIETGKYSGMGNGNRAHFRFKKAGGSYPDGSVVLITLKDGSKRHVTIKNTESRYTK